MIDSVSAYELLMKESEQAIQTAEEETSIAEETKGKKEEGEKKAKKVSSPKS